MQKASHVAIDRMPRVILVKSAAAIATNHVTKLQATSGLILKASANREKHCFINIFPVVFLPTHETYLI